MVRLYHKHTHAPLNVFTNTDSRFSKEASKAVGTIQPSVVAASRHVTRRADSSPGRRARNPIQTTTGERRVQLASTAELYQAREEQRKSDDGPNGDAAP